MTTNHNHNHKQPQHNQQLPLIQGSTVALVTPMTETGDLDLAALEHLVEWQIESGTDQLLVLGTSGEASLLSMQEREDIIKTAVKMAKGKLPIIAGCGGMDLASTKEMTQQAMDLGCDAALVVTPYYLQPPQSGLIQHFETVANWGLPVVVYNAPKRTGVDLADESMAILADHDKIGAILDATGDLTRLPTLQQAMMDANDYEGQDLLMYSAHEKTSRHYVLMGGDGCISAAANIVPKEMHTLMQACVNEDEEVADQMHELIGRLHPLLHSETTPIPIKWALAKCGKINSAYCRPPLMELDPQYHAALEQALIQAGALDISKAK